jgi:hypothetical protein
MSMNARTAHPARTWRLAALLLALAPACSSSPARPTPTTTPPPASPPGPAPVPPGPAADAGSPGLAPDAAVGDPGTVPTAAGDAGAMVPSPSGAPAMALETVQVAGSGDPVTLKTSLAMGELYLLKAAGVVDLGAQKVDAEFAFGGGAPADEAGGTDVGVDVGRKQIHPAVHTTPTPDGPGRMKWYGGFREDHVYYMTITGAGAPLTLKLAKPGGNGTGAIGVSLIALSPAPPRVGGELETVMIPVTKTVVAGTKVTEAGKLYLLQAAGAGKVGGGGTHLGDAEYMDWDVEGTRKNEGEAGADFGIGVDEIVVGMRGTTGAGYQARMRWWGPWRKDHTYYMLFVGTGKVIQFLYFDSGYGDNSPTDRLTVKIFDVP